jgi:hypothetical protein
LVVQHGRARIAGDARHRAGHIGLQLRLPGRQPLRRRIPQVNDTDVSYTTNVPRAADFFFHIPDGERHWITALDGQGKGLVQASTPRLQGRKLFLWGMGSGGRTWQTFLSQPGVTYLEIQAGLARTQTEHLRMPPHAQWTWLEAYGLMEADAEAVHSQSWSAAQQAVRVPLDALISEATLLAEHQASAAGPTMRLSTCFSTGQAGVHWSRSVAKRPASPSPR